MTATTETAKSAEKAENAGTARKARTAKPKDPRSTALRRFGISITVLTVLGHTVLGFEQAYLTPVVAVATTLAVELLLETIEALSHGRAPRYRAPVGKVVDFLLPAYIGGLACAMLLYANDRLLPVVLAAVIAVASKYVIRVRVDGRLRHVLNPSNFGIVVVLLLFPWVGIAPPYQFTEWTDGFLDGAIAIALLAAGTMLNAKLTKRMPLILAWVGGFALQAVVRAAFTDISLISALLPLTGVAFILFTNYMITDPSTSPTTPRNQMAFGFATAAAYGILVQFHVVFGLFFALVAVCVLRGIGLAFLAMRKPAGEPVPAPTAPQPAVVTVPAAAATPREREVV
ncbi:NQR2/RnfD/RnfE family subunit of NADH-ubiquinone oxidoreductase [Prauserella shujinwangii]|uniref:NQR2/RnfD/RnfE family subunit of NADH-ubiquinone oxidoreductase n=1 Tax=Prauserella shujinwangii TaxID=1453103 RepID=A0A2T0LNB1_9PSEU|nr:RnfABCDGE type electron transport complex subunit D [Prauserella shujinwangii]PRX44682.1 NQR2/RnfD/RnfE family subunit of NADH-ubiquinone oxidoreductase [Prauserella shujinwangii]